MRGTRLLPLVLLAACGGGSNADAPPGQGDGPPGQIDAPPLPDAASATCTPNAGTTVSMQLVTNVDDLPILITSPPGDRRMFIVQRSGEVDIFVDGAVLPTKFLDIRDNSPINGPVLAGGEQGLLGLAFHPDYATNRKFYVYYTTERGGDFNEIAEYQTMAGNPNQADPSTERVILQIPDYASNHNGGMMEFGEDGFLYISTGDGGNQDDPNGNGQNLNTWLAKMLRIDVDTPGMGREYGIPAGNPYAVSGGAPEVLMNGLRNPWRWSFDHTDDNIYIGDVGGSMVEEINVVSVASAPGTDFGWEDCEGFLDKGGSGCDTPGGNRVGPVYSAVRPGGGGSSGFNAIIGGAVYRGTCFPGLTGRYFFSDNADHTLRSFVYSGGGATDHQTHGDIPAAPSSIHADGLGELYIGISGGDVYRIEAQ